jgi:hypothetical protein
VVQTVDRDDCSHAALDKARTRLLQQVLELLSHLPDVAVVQTESLEAAAPKLACHVQEKFFGFCTSKSMPLIGQEGEIPDHDVFIS